MNSIETAPFVCQVRASQSEQKRIPNRRAQTNGAFEIDPTDNRDVIIETCSLPIAAAGVVLTRSVEMLYDGFEVFF